MSASSSTPQVLSPPVVHAPLADAVRGALGASLRGRKVTLRWVPGGEAVDASMLGLALARLGVDLTVCCPSSAALPADAMQAIDDAMVCWGGRVRRQAEPAVDADAELVVAATWKGEGDARWQLDALPATACGLVRVGRAHDPFLTGVACWDVPAR